MGEWGRNGPIVVVDNAGDDEFCRLFNRDISSDGAWWKKQGFVCHVLTTAFKFKSLEDARVLLSLFWKYNGRSERDEVKLEVEYKVVVYIGN